MYGSVFKMRPIKGKTDELLAVFMDNSRQPKGMTAAYMLIEDKDGSVWGMGVFESEKAYRDNAASPDQDKQFQRFRALLEGDPEWHDGTIQARAN